MVDFKGKLSQYYFYIFLFVYSILNAFDSTLGDDLDNRRSQVIRIVQGN